MFGAERIVPRLPKIEVLMAQRNRWIGSIPRIFA
jgi:hypothetical protein